jgi:hypothetical protein
MPKQPWDAASTGPLGIRIPRRAPPAALDPSGHGVVGAVLTQQTVRATHVTDTGFHSAIKGSSIQGVTGGWTAATTKQRTRGGVRAITG